MSPLSDGINWVLKAPFTYDVGALGSDDTIEVERGFTTDFASIPRVLWIVLPKWGKYGNAAVVHDYLYWRQTRSRARSDRVMREAMDVLAVPTWQRRAIYASVRLFGWLAWKRNQLNRRQGFDRVIDLDEVVLDASYEHDRPKLMESLWVQRAPSSKQQVIAQNPHLASSVLALAGLKVRHGDVIDAIEPVFAEIGPDLSIVSMPEAGRIGGEGGEATMLARRGSLITGLEVTRGMYFGRDEVVHLRAIHQELTSRGLDPSTEAMSERLGSGNYAEVTEPPLVLRADPGHYISDLEAYTSDHTSGERFLHDIAIAQEPLPAGRP